ncbi:cupin domain-containing protein [Gordonia rhizosphera]|uniref:JmjC domain-containing protein n=1 Tax=Gordonia rhizosphera NBRC 16068 TaxID=1108045 RepID=K6VZ15_9ACTN|nr:cupin domain-containing protein [Gordonia rhizosphera]GAB92155.1 hypothetical protein GORHZ_164_00490 [Gordonia rhizosphera NBRC 16068]
MLSRCISTDPETFAGRHWGRRPMLSRSHELPRDFDDLLSGESVDELLTSRGVRIPFIRMAKEGALVGRECFVGPAGFGAEVADQVDSAMVLAQFADGATIVLQGLHRLWPPVIDFVRDMVDDLGHPVQANAYITPPSNRGFDPHYDVHDVFVLQVTGRKHWRVHEPVYTDPLPSQPWTDHRAAIVRRADDAPVIDTILEPGDALYLPRGWIHSAQALGETSIHLTVGVEPLTARDVMAAVLDELATVAEFRASLPMRADPADAIAGTIATAIDVLRERAGEFGTTAATRLATRHARRTRPVAVAPLATLEAIDNLTADTAVRWRHGLHATRHRCGERVELRLPDRTVSFPAVCADALAQIRRGDTVSARTLPGLDAADGEVVIRRLLREAVVIVVGTDR